MMTRQSILRRWPRLLIVGFAIAALWLGVAWIAAKLLIVKAELSSADAIVVLSGPATYLERSDWAARLYQRGHAPVIIVSNEGLISKWSKADDRNLYFFELTTRELRNRGVAAKDVQVVSEIGAGTYPESQRLCDYAASHKLKRLLVVTSAYHSRRALWSMRRACAARQIQIGIDGPPPGWQTPSPGRWWLSEWGWKVVAGEYVKLIYYRWHY